MGESIKTTKGIFVLNKLQLGKRSKIKGPIIGEIVTIGKNSEAEDIYGNKIELGKFVTANNILGRDIIIKDNAIIKGQVEYQNSLETGIDVVFEFEPKQVESLPDKPIPDTLPEELVQKASELK